MFQIQTNGCRSWSVSWRCEACGDTTWPVYRIVGYPTPAAWDLVDEGLAVIKGCIMNDEFDDKDYECPNCERGVDVPEAYRHEALV